MEVSTAALAPPHWTNAVVGATVQEPTISMLMAAMADAVVMVVAPVCTPVPARIKLAVPVPVIVQVVKAAVAVTVTVEVPAALTMRHDAGELNVPEVNVTQAA
jgi:predicted deacylase